MEDNAELRPSDHRLTVRLVVAVLAILAFWLALRIVFFQRFEWFDDLHHVRYALFWDRFPINHWEARLTFNATLRLALLALGFGPVTVALPGLAGSLMVLGAGLWMAWRHWRSVGMVVVTGLLLASMQSEVRCTFPSARVLATGLCALGMAAFLTDGRRGSAVAAGVLWGLSVCTHEMTPFPIAGLLAAAAILRYSTIRRCLLAGAALIAAIVVFDFGIYYLWTGDPLYHLRIIHDVQLPMQSPEENVRYPLTAAGGLNLGFFWRPIQELLASPAFGIVGGLAVVGGLLLWRRRRPVGRVITLATLLAWAWLAYGSVSPTRYLTFPELGYMRPLAPLLALAAAEALLLLSRARLRVAILGGAVAANLVVLGLAGPWTQKFDNARDLLLYANDHPQTLCVADDHTLDQMALWNEFKPMANVYAVPTSEGLLFAEPKRLTDELMRSRDVAVMVCPRGISPEYDPSYGWVMKHAGPPLYENGTNYRLLTYVLPAGYRESHAWTLRKEPARVCRLAD